MKNDAETQIMLPVKPFGCRSSVTPVEFLPRSITGGLLVSRSCLCTLFALCLVTSHVSAGQLSLSVTGLIDFGPGPVAADFFGPGSLPFDGQITFIGAPLSPSGVANAIMYFGPTSGMAETIPIEMLELQLMSDHPIAVSFGAITSFYNVFATLDPALPSTGTMMLEPTSPSGGNITAVDLNLGLETRWVPVDPGPERRIPVETRPLSLPIPPLPDPGRGEYEDLSPLPPGIRDPLKLTEPAEVPGREVLEITIMPEPSTWVMGVCGLTALITIARRTIARRRGALERPVAQNDFSHGTRRTSRPWHPELT
ncbi:MAG: hypothetical protein AB7O59_02365 [Pirellulales bacterium]